MIRQLKPADPSNIVPVPVDQVTVSCSGLNPNISVAAVLNQIPRMARVRGLSEIAISALMDQFIQRHQFGFLGEPRVNVLLFNLALGGIK
jgi:K+-transporting ATPase ATPase C chain